MSFDRFLQTYYTKLLYNKKIHTFQATNLPGKIKGFYSLQNKIHGVITDDNEIYNLKEPFISYDNLPSVINIEDNNIHIKKKELSLTPKDIDKIIKFFRQHYKGKYRFLLVYGKSKKNSICIKDKYNKHIDNIYHQYKTYKNNISSFTSISDEKFLEMLS